MAKNPSHSSDANEQWDSRIQSIPRDPDGSLIVIGGHEKKEGHRPVLELLANRVGLGKLIVATLASDEPESQWREYERTFRELGVQRIEQLDIRRREDLLNDPRLEALDDARVLFFTGGDQIKITSKFGGTPLCRRMQQIYQEGATIAGTSSGASVMTEVMIAGGESDGSNQLGRELRLAPGLGLISDVIIDQHFAERGRMGRLLGAVANNPRLLGIGIDEDTAFFFEGHRRATVIGSGAVYIVDGRDVTYSNAGEDQDQALSVFGMRLHVLSHGDQFDLTNRTPAEGKRETGNTKPETSSS